MFPDRLLPSPAVVSIRARLGTVEEVATVDELQVCAMHRLAGRSR
jgi:hypothetical protein